MTKEEHITRAMLLGKVYDPNDHTYCDPNVDGSTTYNNMLDADTLKLLPVQGIDYLNGPLIVRQKEFGRAYD